MESQTHPNDIPIWWNGTQRWMTGLTKRTTCDDVIYALLYSGGLHETESTDNYAIFEKWREVERPLSARTKLLKVWTFWDQEQNNVKLSMRSLDDYFLPGESSLYVRSKRRHRRSSQHKSRHSGHERCVAKRGCVECSRLRSLEQLVKLVVSQERKIQDLSERIHRTDRQVDNHESRIHQNRVEQNGLDYVQNSYLNSHSSSSNSSIDSSTFTTIDLKKVKAIFPDSSWHELEEIIRMAEDLTNIEQRLASEQAKANELTPEVNKLMQEMGLAAEQETNSELEEVKVHMVRTLTNHITNEYREKELDRKSAVVQSHLEAKMEVLRDLQNQLTDIDRQMNQPHVASENFQLSSSTPLSIDSITSDLPMQHERLVNNQNNEMIYEKQLEPFHQHYHQIHQEYPNEWHHDTNTFAKNGNSNLNPHSHPMANKIADDDYLNQNSFINDKTHCVPSEANDYERSFSSFLSHKHDNLPKYNKDFEVKASITSNIPPVVNNDSRNRGRRNDVRKGSRIRSRSEEKGRSKNATNELYRSGPTSQGLRNAVGWDEEKGLRYSPAILNQYGLDPVRYVSNPGSVNKNWKGNSRNASPHDVISQLQSPTSRGGARLEVHTKTPTDTNACKGQNLEYNSLVNKKGNFINRDERAPSPLRNYNTDRGTHRNIEQIQNNRVSSPVQAEVEIRGTKIMQGKTVNFVFEKSVSASPSSSTDRGNKPGMNGNWRSSPRGNGMSLTDPIGQTRGNAHVTSSYVRSDDERRVGVNATKGGNDDCTRSSGEELSSSNHHYKDVSDTIHVLSSEFTGVNHSQRNQRYYLTCDKTMPGGNNDHNIQTSQGVQKVDTSQGQHTRPNAHSPASSHLDQQEQVNNSYIPRQNQTMFNQKIEMRAQRNVVNATSNQNNTSHVHPPMPPTREESPTTHPSSDNQSVHKPMHTGPSHTYFHNTEVIHNSNDSSNTNVIDLRHDKPTSRGALYHIISDKLNKTRPNESSPALLNPSINLGNFQPTNNFTPDQNTQNNLHYHNSSSSSSSTATINASMSSTETLTHNPHHPQSKKNNKSAKSEGLQQANQNDQRITDHNSKSILLNRSSDASRQVDQHTIVFESNHQIRSKLDGRATPNSTASKQFRTEDSHRVPINAKQITPDNGNGWGQNYSKINASSANSLSHANPYDDELGYKNPISERECKDRSNTPNSWSKINSNVFESNSSASYDSGLSNQNSPVSDITPRTPRLGRTDINALRTNAYRTEDSNQRSPLLSARSQYTKPSDQLTDSGTSTSSSANSGNRRRRVNPHFCDIDQSEKSINDTRKLVADPTIPFNGTDHKLSNGYTKSAITSGEEFGNRQVNFSSFGSNKEITSIKSPLLNRNQRTLDVRNIVSQRDGPSIVYKESAIRNKSSYKESMTNGVTAIKNKLEESNDSNSDTGLSSMHSDETANLETLV